MLEVVAYANEDIPELTNFTLSLERLGYSYTIIGKGEKWVNFMTKVRACFHYIKTLPEEKLVLVCDAYDIIAQRGPEDLLSFYHEYNKPLVTGAELLCFPKTCTKLENYWSCKDKPGRNIHVNGGFYMGKVKDILETLQFMLDSGLSDDQRALGLYTEQNPEKVALDTNSLLVADLNNLELGHIQKREDGLYYSITGTKPCFFHATIKNSDVLRYNFIGKEILGEEFLPTPLSALIPEWKNRMNKISYYSYYIALFLLFFLLLLLCSLYLNCLPLFFVLTLLLALVIVFLLREGIIS